MLKYPTPLSLNFFWNFRSVLGFFLVIQILTRVFLSIHYSPFIEESFSSVVHMIEDVNYRSTIRYSHVNRASFFIRVIYLHLSRGLFYKRYINTRRWVIRVILLILSILTAFLGYVLPWRQISYWGATVITNLLSAFPRGQNIVFWIWRRYSVGSPTLSRFFSFHFLLPFIIAFFSLVHLFFIHTFRSGTPVGSWTGGIKVNFIPYFRVKDVVGFFVVLLFFFILVFFLPDLLTDPDNYIPANAMVTPPHIKPEWYYLFAYAILRCIPNKFLRVVALVASISVFFLSPLLSKVYYFNSFFRRFFFFFLIL